MVPKPNSLEKKSSFVDRFILDNFVKMKQTSLYKRRNWAYLEYEKNKANSIVSIKTKFDEFLIF